MKDSNMPLQGRKYTLDGEPIELYWFFMENWDWLTSSNMQQIISLEPGEEATFGGGAGATFILRRTK